MTDLKTSITQKNQFEVVKLERQKLQIECNNLNREILEITNSINVIRKSRTYLKSDEVRVVALKEYSSMMNTLVRLEKDRSAKKEEYATKQKDLEAKIRQSKSLESIIGKSGDVSNIVLFPPRGIYLKDNNGKD
jgi:hypothetical protein